MLVHDKLCSTQTQFLLQMNLSLHIHIQGLARSQTSWVLQPGADPGFQVRGGGGALKQIALSGGRREKCWGISCEKSRFYDKKIIFFPIAEGGAKIFGVFRVKNHDFTPKNLIFSNFRGGGLDPPLLQRTLALSICSHFSIHTLKVT